MQYEELQNDEVTFDITDFLMFNYEAIQQLDLLMIIDKRPNSLNIFV